MKAKRRKQQARRRQQDTRRRDRPQPDGPTSPDPSSNSGFDGDQVPPRWPFSEPGADPGSGQGPHFDFGSGFGPDDDFDPELDRIDELLDTALALGTPIPRRVLSALSDERPVLVASEIELRLLTQVDRLWSWGWLPTELVRQTKRAGGTRASVVVATAIANDHLLRHPSTLHPRWVANLKSLDLPDASDRGQWLLALASDNPSGWPSTMVAALRALMAMIVLAPMSQIIPPPGSSSNGDGKNGDPSIIDLSSQTTLGDDNTVLERVRALLAQAESTTFEAEAEAFTAKAQELMARHAIDMALVWGRSDRAEEPSMIRIPIDDPYTNAKSLLLHHVAQSANCRSVFHPPYALASVVGFESDLRAAELLFTSLLVQAHQALKHVSDSTVPGSRLRSRGFRSSFLTSYATRIGQRLAEVNAEVAADHRATGASDHLPVLADRSSLFDKMIDEQFKTLTTPRSRAIHDPAGWGAGHDAANRAQLGFDELGSRLPEL